MLDLILLQFAGAWINVKVEIPTIIYKEMRHCGGGGGGAPNVVYIKEILYKATVNTVAVSETELLVAFSFQFE